MTLDNIAMVFAPTVLRSPSDDLNVMVANSLREKVCFQNQNNQD
jgi:hypothetical protein